MQNVNEQYIQKGGILGKLSIFTKWLIWLCPKPKPPSDRGHKTYNTGRPFLGHHYFVISLSDLWPRVSRKIFLLCLFVCLFGVYCPTWEFFTHMEHHCRWRAANFDLCSALMAIEQWANFDLHVCLTLMAIEQGGFFNLPQLLRHLPTLYNGHLQGPVTLAPVAEHLAMELSLPVFTTKVCLDRGLNPDLPHARRMLYL